MHVHIAGRLNAHPNLFTLRPHNPNGHVVTHHNGFAILARQKQHVILPYPSAEQSDGRWLWIGPMADLVGADALLVGEAVAADVG
ncbi:MAG: hypothetical protein ABIP11_05370 [Luteimonas sp.]